MVPLQEQMLIECLPSLPAGKLLANTVGRGQFATEYARRHPGAEITCWSLDLYRHQQCLLAAALPDNLRFACTPDLPEEEVDLAALSFGQQGDGELARELLQQASQRLRIGGTLVAATDNARDMWLEEQVQKQFTSVKRIARDAGVVYFANKLAAPKKIKRYDAEVIFRDGERLLKLKTRPGIFSHREVDPGARALLRAMTIAPGMRVLDIGCGSGVVGIAAAARRPTAVIHGIDSNARAVECAAWSAAENGLNNAVFALDCDGRSVAPDSFDLALANPPYYSHFKIAELFVGFAARGLQRGGRLLVVTKTPQWYADRLTDLRFARIEVTASKRYVIVSAEKF